MVANINRTGKDRFTLPAGKNIKKKDVFS